MTKALMNLSSDSSVAQASPLVDAPQAIVSTRQWRRLVVRRRRHPRRERRGIILIFVVVLLMLLAIMGTAYLATSRADRVAITSNGAIAGQQPRARLADQNNLNTVFEAAQKRVQNAIIEDLFNVPPGDLVRLQVEADRSGNVGAAAKATIFSAFRQEQLPASLAQSTLAVARQDFNHFYYNYDAPGRADPYLASLLPTKLPAPSTTGIPAGSIVWPWISAPLPGKIEGGIELAPFFADPRALRRTAATPLTNPGFSFAYARRPDATERDAESDFAAFAVHNTQVLERQNLVVSAVPMLRSDSLNGSTAATPADRLTTRVYPGFTAYSGPGVTTKIIAGDSDGDGIADGGLSPVILNNNANGIYKYLDTANGVVYFVSYRVVDNSAKVNVNTALTARSDFAFPNGGTPTAPIETRILSLAPAGPSSTPTNGPDQPNLGFFRSNVGLIELVRNTVDAIDPGSSGIATEELKRLLAARIPGLGQTNTQEPNPVNSDAAARRFGFVNDPANPTVPSPTPPAGQVLAFYGEGTRNIFNPPAINNVTDYYYRFSTFGDQLEQTLSRRQENIGSIRVGRGVSLLSGAFVSLPASDTVAFASGGGGLLNNLITTGTTENALLLSTRMSAPNFATTPEGGWSYFPPGEVKLWFGWTKDFSMAFSPAPIATTPQATGTNYAIALLDGDNTFSKKIFTYDTSADAPPKSETGVDPVDLARSIRPLLTTRSGVTSTVPMRYDGGDVPPGMPGYGPMDASLSKYPAEVVSAATGTKEQLWRAYWSAMTLNRANGTSPIVSVLPKKQLRDPTPGSVTGQFNYVSTDVDNHPYRRAYDAFLPPDRHYSVADDRGPIPMGGRGIQRLREDKMTLLRSAIAACNTIDLRDNDDDITAMTIDLGDEKEYLITDPANPVHPATTATGARGKIYARVYGTERQLVISSVVIDSDPTTGITFVGVELFNPSDRPIKLDGYHLAVMNRGESTPVSLENGYVFVDDPAGDPVKIDETQMSSGGKHTPATDPTMILPASLRGIAGGTTLAPGGFVIITNGVAAPADVTLPTASTTPPTPLAPNDVTTADPPAATITPPPQVIVRTEPMPYLSRLVGRDSTMRLCNELALFRTRRADGEVYRDYDYTTGGTPLMEANAVYRRPTMNEDLTTVQGLSTLVPVDAVDCRSLDGLTKPAAVTPASAPQAARPTPPAVGVASRYWYTRMTTPFLRFRPSADAWKCFYAGLMYDVRPERESLKPKPTYTAPTYTEPRMPDIEPSAPPVLVADWAWKAYPTSGSLTPPATALGEYRSGATAGVVPFAAPTIPIQNATPYTQYDPSVTPPVTYNPSGTAPRTDVDHPPFQYPYGSPFARNGDLMNVPFIGTYKIYRVQITGPQTTGGASPKPNFTILPPNAWTAPAAGAAPATPYPNRALYEYVPITVDAVNVAPDPTEWTTVGGLPPLAYSNPSVGRFDPRSDIYPNNDWAADVWTYVVARKSNSNDLAFPDIPTSPPPTGTAYFNDPMNPATDQDGPVLSVGDSALLTGIGANTQNRVPWIEWRSDTNTGPQQKAPNSYSRSAAAPLAGTSEPQSRLIEGTINLNTAPPIVLRMLPWTADPDTGFVDQVATNTAAALDTNQIQRQRTGELSYYSTSSDFDTTTPLTPADQVPVGRQMRQYKYGPFGFTSPFDIASMPYFAGNDTRTLPLTDATAATTWDHNSNQKLMRMGLLNPLQRSDNETDFRVTHMNANRVSNLTSQRSDCFTVYVTVQAWTWVGSDARQDTDTRLVGERRGSFVVDRSRISQTNYKPSDLIIYPVEQE